MVLFAAQDATLPSVDLYELANGRAALMARYIDASDLFVSTMLSAKARSRSKEHPSALAISASRPEKLRTSYRSALGRPHRRFETGTLS